MKGLKKWVVYYTYKSSVRGNLELADYGQKFA